MEMQWLIGTLIATATFMLGAIGGVIARDRALTGMIAQGDDKLHDRINRMRDDLTENYVQRRDFEQHASRMEGNLRDIREELRDNTKAMQSLLTHVKTQSPP